MAKAFTGPDADARYERAGKWLLATIYDRKDARDWCDRKGVAIRKQQAEGIGSSGGFLVPEELESAILDLRDTYGAFRRRACVWPMGSDSGLFPRRTGTAQATFFGENTAATATSTNMDAVKLTAKKLGAEVLMSSELAEDSIFDLVNYVANELAWAFASKEDDCAFNGDGTSTYGGMRGLTQIVLDGSHTVANVPAAQYHSTFASLDGADLGNLVGAVRGSATPRAAWFVSQVGFGECFVRLDAIGSGFLYTKELDGVMTPHFSGYPIILSQKLPQVATSLSGKAMMAFGDMYAGAVLGQRRGLTIKRSDERYLDSDQIAILATERFDAVIHDLGDNVNPGSLAVLVAP